MLDPTLRLLRLLSLLQSRGLGRDRIWSGAELAERIGCSPRTVRRDIDRLRGLGYPIHAARGTPGYRLDAGADLPPLLLDDDEAIAIVIGLRTAATRHISGIEETAERALDKLERLLPYRLRHRVAGLDAVAVPRPTAGPKVELETLTAIAGARHERARLRFDYTGHDGREAVRDTEPHRLVHTGRRWYLVAYDVDRRDWRSFRVDRMRPRRPYGPGFAPREIPGGDAVAFVTRGVTGRLFRVLARVRLRAPAEAMIGRLPPTVSTVEPEEGGTCVVEFGGDDTRQLALHMCAFDTDAEILDGPPELPDHLARLAGRLRTLSIAAHPVRHGGEG